jgi:hypothetical protein
MLGYEHAPRSKGLFMRASKNTCFGLLESEDRGCAAPGMKRTLCLLLFGHFPSLSGHDPNTNFLILSNAVDYLFTPTQGANSPGTGHDSRALCLRRTQPLPVWPSHRAQAPAISSGRPTPTPGMPRFRCGGFGELGYTKNARRCDPAAGVQLDHLIHAVKQITAEFSLVM